MCYTAVQSNSLGSRAFSDALVEPLPCQALQNSMCQWRVSKCDSTILLLFHSPVQQSRLCIAYHDPSAFHTCKLALCFSSMSAHMQNNPLNT